MRPLALGLLAAFPLACFAQQSSSVTWFYDLKYRESAFVASSPVGRLNNVLGTGLTLDVDAFGGVSGSGVPIGGFAVGKRFPLAMEAQGYFGLGLNIGQGRNPSACVGFGASWRF